MVEFGSSWLLAQAAGVGSPPSAAAAAYLALRRWCGGLTLAPSRIAPDWGPLWLLAAAPAVLLVLAVTLQGPRATFGQFMDLPGHLVLLREATARLRGSIRLVTTLLACTVLSWTAAQSVAFLGEDQERGRADLLLLQRSRRPVELIVEHGATAASTPLRDVAGLADDLPLLLIATVLLLTTWSRMSRGVVAPSHLGSNPDNYPATLHAMVGGCGVLYVLYRLISRIAGGGGLPVGNCLIIEVLLIPLLMLVVDGFLLAWCLTELRDGPLGDDRSERLDPEPALRLLPGACLGCLAALPARYTATAVLLATQHLPAAWMSLYLGAPIRWLLGPGLVVLQGCSLVVMGIVGAVAWTGGTAGDALVGFRRLLAGEGGRLAFCSLAAAAACGLVSAAAYTMVFTLPPAGWVLPAADAYAHYASLPVGLLTLAALVQLAARCLPAARHAETARDVPPNGALKPVDGVTVGVAEAQVDPEFG